MASRKIRVEGHPGLHTVTENMGYNHTRGVYARAVMIEGRERIVVADRASGPWRINVPAISGALLRSIGQ